MHDISRFKWTAALILLCTLLAGFASAQEVRQLPSPAGEGSGQSNLTVTRDGRVLLSWIERLDKGRFALRFAAREGAGWSAPRTIAEGSNWFINWADFPSLLALPDGTLAAHWLVKSGAGAYAYDVAIARSQDGGKTWSAPVTPHRDGTQTEHGFVSLFPSEGRLAAVWLDGRETQTQTKQDGASKPSDEHAHGEMTLRYATLDRSGVVTSSERLLDARVCECCQTSAANTSEGVVVVYRDRSEREVRDISIVRRLSDGRWTQPATVHADNWQIDGCPVNGPSVAAEGRRVAVGWFTLAGGTPRVQLAFSKDAGATFGQPFKVDDGDPIGRVEVLMLEDDSALVVWIERTKTGGEVRARRIYADGRADKALTVAPSGTARSSGFPQAARTRTSVVFSWTGTTRVLTAEMPLARKR
ncbi:MAG TPA: sialidase family protein [Pyrinomonadaceae bacterium]|nr:sialidase family protein [Pyrinomonadaceae bacterium]